MADTHHGVNISPGMEIGLAMEIDRFCRTVRMADSIDPIGLMTETVAPTGRIDPIGVTAGKSVTITR